MRRACALLLAGLQDPGAWVADRLHRQALAQGISVSPGHLFSPQSSFRHHLRLNCANEVTPRVLRAVDRIGEICRAAAKR